ncbi:MAG: winged helix-turn-helix transcriptional regulator, partial [Thermoplasmata archaeon]
HLDKLERDGVIKTKRDGTFKRYYPMGISINGEAKPILTDIQQQIKEIIVEHPGASQKEIVYLLDEPKAKINYHIKNMERKGIIRVERDEQGYTLCYLAADVDYIPPVPEVPMERPKKVLPERPEKPEKPEKKPVKKKEFAARPSTKRLVKKYEGAKKKEVGSKPKKKSSGGKKR